MAEHKLLGIILAAGLCLVGGIFMVIDWNTAKPEGPEDAAVAVVAPDSADPSAQPKAAEPTVSPTPLSGKIVVSKRPVEVLASPSASAAAMYGFPAGRPFRVLGGDGNYVKIQDVKSGASGWIEKAALAPAPPPVPAAAQRANRRDGRPTATNAKPRKNTNAKPRKKKTRSDTSTAAAEPEPAPKPKRRGLFGGGGPFGGLFGGGG
jgi:hypothetical protein